MDRLAARCQILDVNAAVAEAYSTARLALKRIGRPIPENDLWIAAICLHHGLTLATEDAHFALIPGLSVARP